MMDKLKKVLDGKKSKLSGVEQEAKMKVMQALSEEMGGAMKDKLKGLKKVTVASNSPEGLKKGLQKAEEMVAGKSPEMGNEESECEACKGSGCPACEMMEEASESPEMEESEDEESEDEEEEKSAEEMTPAELDQKIAELQALKQAKMKV